MEAVITGNLHNEHLLGGKTGVNAEAVVVGAVAVDEEVDVETFM